MARRESPRFALVRWPDAESDVPNCITLDAVPAAVARGALVLAREDAILSEPLPKPAMDMTLLSGPRRHPEPPPPVSNGDEA